MNWLTSNPFTKTNSSSEEKTITSLRHQISCLERIDEEQQKQIVALTTFKDLGAKLVKKLDEKIEILESKIVSLERIITIKESKIKSLTNLIENECKESVMISNRDAVLLMTEYDSTSGTIPDPDQYHEYMSRFDELRDLLVERGLYVKRS